MSITVLTFDALGNGHCLFTEAIDLSSLGALKMVRASRIEFNNQTQQWEVRSIQGALLCGPHSIRNHAPGQFKIEKTGGLKPQERAAPRCPFFYPLVLPRTTALFSHLLR